MDGDLMPPYGISRHLLPGPPTPTEPIPVIDPTPTPPTPTVHLQPVPVAVKAAEVCGPCGSTFSVDWIGRTDALKVLREWRSGHRCSSPEPDGLGSKVGHVERVGFTPE
jgi:hypothetical protein